MENIIVALITAAASVIAVVITNNKGNEKMQQQYAVQQAVTDERIEQLRKSVEKHNNVIERTFRLEEHIRDIDATLKELKGCHK